MHQSVHNAEILIVVGSYNMNQQVCRTLVSLSPNYQRTNRLFVKLCLIDNASDSQLHGFDGQLFKPWSFEYIRINERNIPIHHAIQSRVEGREGIIGILIDGARLCSNHIIDQAAKFITDNPMSLVAVLNYQLGHVCKCAILRHAVTNSTSIY